ncbi:DUF6030 family protein [Allorhizobium sp. BGMRC 0089]|nr:DUF6030 family protein [Allorhizobium sonneratiae]MCM2291413.1 DUF6030 family protein [Allorhizobium sonneratiae]
MRQHRPKARPSTVDAQHAARRQRRRGRLVFAGIVAAFCLTIAAALLFSLERSSLSHFRTGFSRQMTVADETVRAQPHILQRHPRPETRPETRIFLPAPFFEMPDILQTSAFVRDMPITGPVLCKRMQSEGMVNEGWKKNPFNQQDHECFFEKSFPVAHPDEDAPSFFIMVKGDAAGVIMQVRLKIIEPQGNGEVMTFYRKAIDLLKRFGWQDFDPDFERLLRFQSVESHRFGISLSLQKEFAGHARYNVMMMVEDDGVLEQQTRAFFTKASRFRPYDGLFLFPRQRW